MPSSKLPERASLEYLKRLAKDRLQELRRADPGAKLATALLAVAQDHGFTSWRALKAEVDSRQVEEIARFFDACANGDVELLRTLLAREPSLARAGNPRARHQGWTGLHAAARAGHLDAVRLLIEYRADPNAREAGDNTYPLHWAAAQGHLDIVRALVESGADVHGLGDVHELDVIGWATFFRDDLSEPMTASRRDVVSFLIDKGARHHIFSAMSVGDVTLVREVVELNPESLDRRMSRFEGGQTPLHFALRGQRHDMLDLLVELGADVEAEDLSGRTALAVAMLRGDREAARRLTAAGAKPPDMPAPSSLRVSMAGLAGSVKKNVPMIYVADVASALDWYISIGFREIARYADDGVVNFGMVAFGDAELMLNLHGRTGAHDASVWFYTDRIDDLYQLLKSSQLAAARAALAGEAGGHQGIDFMQDIEDMFYGARQFCIRDPNGYQLYFIQSAG